jgi:hypothetical protein
MNQMVPSDEAKDFMKMQETYDKNDSSIIDQNDDWYYADKKFVSNSQLGQLLRGGPQTLKAYYERGQKDTPAFVFGRAAHCLLLEAESFDSRYYSIDDEDICLEIGGARPKTTKKYKEWLEPILEDNKHRDLLSGDDMQTLQDMVDKAMSYPQVKDLINSAKKREVIYQKTLLGVPCKIKVDAINTGNFILDYKTSKDPATLFNFAKTVRNYHYDRQGAFYSDVAGVNSFWFLVQEKTYPYTVCLAELSPDSLEEGRKKYQLGLEMYKNHFIDNPTKIDSYLEMGSV